MCIRDRHRINNNITHRMATAKHFQALLNGIYLNVFNNDESMTPEVLHEQIFANSPVTLDEVNDLFVLISKIFKQGALENWDPQRLETVLKKTNLTDVQQEVFLKYWKLQKPKIQEFLRQKSNWSNSLLKLQWRIDIKSKSKSNPELNEPSAIVEMTIGKHTEEASKQKLVRFEMNKQQLDDLVSKFSSIQDQLQGLPQ
eukprot:TRINITY_DN742_c0_g3_i1.p1 TRINITY_DN742_c0_g3~~TRINITY_DN742_c0_g3_i1.p1  ORF type:complete len:199 (+),score=58.23 TRINITY_DN742_c0_g3_i1:2-598(+)